MSTERKRLRTGVTVATWMMPFVLAGSVVAQEPAQDTASLHGPSTLQGSYGFSLTQSCVRTPFQAPPASGFDPATKQLRVAGEFVSGFGAGILRFAKDGIVTLEDGLITEIAASQVSSAQTPVSPGTKFECVGRYQIQPSRKISLSMSCEVAVPQPGLRVVIEPVVFEGFVGSTRTMNLNTTKRDIHTVTVWNGGTALQQRERICLQSLNLDRL